MPELIKNLIIGGGLAGMATAYWAGAQGKGNQVVLLEKKGDLLEGLRRKPGEPLLVASRTGYWPGCCPRGAVAGERFLATWPGTAAIEWLESLGLNLETDTAGACHIRSRGDLLTGLEAALAAVHVQVVKDCAVEEISRSPGGFRVWSKDGQRFDASRVCLATGGERNHGMALAREGGEDPAPVTPAYLRLRLASPKLGERLGLMNREVALRCEKTGEESSGWVSISSRGIEGAALSALSAKVGEPWHQLGYRIKLKVDWLPAASGSSIRGELHSRSVHGGRRTVGESPLLGFTVRQWETFLKAARIDGDTPWARLKAQKLQTLVQRLKGDIISCNGMGLPSGERAWAGGVNPLGLDAASSQSLSTPGLYFAGEILDLLGLPGGTHVNLAWATAYVAGSSMGLSRD
jgi:predicted Rossmann fold flavoprotein